MKNILRIGMLLCMFLLGSVGWAMAEEPESSGSTTRYVKGDYTGNDSDGTVDKPYTTLQEAINALSSGGTIIISPSTTDYTLPNSITRSFTFIGNSEKNGNKPAINLGDVDYYTNAQTFEFKNLQLKRNNKDYLGFKHSRKETYTNCDISGLYWTYAPTVSFSNCSFKQTTKDMYMVWVYGSGHISFKQCSFRGASGKAILIYNEDRGDSNEFHVSVNNCTFDADTIQSGKTAIQIVV